jgi:hypothetical protein
VSLLLALARGATGQVAAPPALSDSQRVLVERGEGVQVLQSVSNSPWPRSIVYRFIEATPEECLAVLTDYELQARYIPRMSSSRIVRRGGRETDVQYVIEIPIFPDERTISRQRLAADSGIYQVTWRTLVSDSLHKGSITTGRATFAAMTNSRSGKRGTLMVHEQAVVPSSAFARVPYVRGKAIESGRETAEAIARQVEKERAGDRVLLRSQLSRLREALSAPPDSGRVPPPPHESPS